MTKPTHPLARLFAEIALGRLPPGEGEVEVFGSPPGRLTPSSASLPTTASPPRSTATPS
jgi:hypothetical protein